MIEITKFLNRTAYEAASLPTKDSRVALIENEKNVEVDEINVVTTLPEVGDALFIDSDGNKIYYKGGNKLVPSLFTGLTFIGVVFNRRGNKVKILNKTETSLKWADVLQYALNAPTLDGEEHTQSIGLQLAGGTSAGYGSYTTILFTYTATTLEEVVTVLNAAIEAKKEEVGFTNTVWAYLTDDDYNIVTENATKILVQIDTWSDYRQYQVRGGTFVTWGDMPATSTNGWRINGKIAGAKILNVSRGAAYYGNSANGRTPTEMVQLNEDAAIIHRDAFNGEFGALLREAYGTYENYIKSEYSLMYPLKLGVFSLMDGIQMTKKYGLMTAPTKNGGTKYKFPALHYALTIGYNTPGLEVGDWHLTDVTDGVEYMADDILKIINATLAKVGATQVSNGSHRWFARRYSVYNTWHFSGGNGYLNYGGVTGGLLCRAVGLLDIE